MKDRHSSRVFDWTTQQIDFHLEDARQTLRLHFDDKGISVQPYATLSAKLPLPLDLCAFTECVERRPGFPARAVQSILKRREVMDTLSAAAVNDDHWPNNPVSVAMVKTPKLFRVPPDF